MCQYMAWKYISADVSNFLQNVLLNNMEGKQTVLTSQFEEFRKNHKIHCKQATGKYV